ncbi:hypothetical protein SprV_0200756500 [Sparganum proliferum]
MQGLRGKLRIDDKLFWEMFLERLPADVQTILASGSEDLSVSRPADMADRMLEVQRFQPSSLAQLPLPTPSGQIATQLAAMAEDMVTLKLQLAHLTFSRSSNRRRSVHDLEQPILVFIIRVPVETGKVISQRIDATAFFGSSGSGRTFYFCDSVTHRRILVVTGAQIRVVPQFQPTVVSPALVFISMLPTALSFSLSTACPSTQTLAFVGRPPGYL